MALKLKSFEKNRVYLGIGSNLGDRLSNLSCAVQMLDQADIVHDKLSSIYETKPVGFKEQPDFYNAIVAAETSSSPDQLLAEILLIETHMGRKRLIRWGPRIIDIDILLYNRKKVDKANLVIPHAELLNRRFVLMPLHEIAPDLDIPGTELTIHQALIQCPDQNRVEPIISSARFEQRVQEEHPC
jgi:2-amino-4-hydroxy-6-hydroxymethyldihydropteridine diphosphokinase